MQYPLRNTWRGLQHAWIPSEKDVEWGSPKSLGIDHGTCKAQPDEARPLLQSSRCRIHEKSRVQDEGIPKGGMGKFGVRCKTRCHN